MNIKLRKKKTIITNKVMLHNFFKSLRVFTVEEKKNKNECLLNRLLKPLKVKVKPKCAVVAIEEEFGFRQWIWVTELTPRELEMFWRRQHKIDKFYFYPPKMKQGKFIEVTNSVSFNIWEKLDKIAYRCHIFDDESSQLLTPKGVSIDHMGYYPAVLRSNDNLVEFDLYTPGTQIIKGKTISCLT